MNKTLPYKNELTAAAIIILTVFSVNKRLSWEKRLMARQAQDEKKIQENENLVVKWQESRRKYKDAKGDFFFRDEISFKRLVQETAWDNGVDIKSLHFSQKSIDFYQKAGIVLVCSAHFQDVSDFLKGLEKRHIFVESLSFSRRDRDKEGDAKLGLFAYILGDDS